MWDLMGTADSQTHSLTRNILWLECFVLCRYSTCNSYQTRQACYCYVSLFQ